MDELIEVIQSKIWIRWQPSHTNDTSLEGILNQKAYWLDTIIDDHKQSSFTIPSLSVNLTTFKIGPNIISSQLKNSILSSVHEISMFSYLTKKFQWSKLTYQNIMWTDRTLALSSRRTTECIQIYKLLYNWDPHNSLKTFTQSTDQNHFWICCKTQIEDTNHFAIVLTGIWVSLGSNYTRNC